MEVSIIYLEFNSNCTVNNDTFPFRILTLNFYTNLKLWIFKKHNIIPSETPHLMFRDNYLCYINYEFVNDKEIQTKDIFTTFSVIPSNKYSFPNTTYYKYHNKNIDIKVNNEKFVVFGDFEYITEDYLLLDKECSISEDVHTLYDMMKFNKFQYKFYNSDKKFLFKLQTSLIQGCHNCLRLENPILYVQKLRYVNHLTRLQIYDPFNDNEHMRWFANIKK